jgi:hypothetical protein
MRLKQNFNMFNPLPPYSPVLNHRDLYPFSIFYFFSLSHSLSSLVKCTLVIIDHKFTLPLLHAVLALVRFMDCPDPTTRPLRFLKKSKECIHLLVQFQTYKHSRVFALMIKLSMRLAFD